LSEIHLEVTEIFLIKPVDFISNFSVCHFVLFSEYTNQKIKILETV